MIRFVMVKLAKEVHAQALGFTDRIFVFVMAEEEDQVGTLVEAWCARKEIEFEKILSVGPALQQDPERYTFPGQIIGYDRPQACIDAEANPPGTRSVSGAAP